MTGLIDIKSLAARCLQNDESAIQEHDSINRLIHRHTEKCACPNRAESEPLFEFPSWKSTGVYCKHPCACPDNCLNCEIMRYSTGRLCLKRSDSVLLTVPQPWAVSVLEGKRNA